MERREDARGAGASGKSGRGRGKNAPRAEGIGNAIAMPFANINFSELIKAAISLSLFLSLSRIHENDDVDVDGRRSTSTSISLLSSSPTTTSPRWDNTAAECTRLYFTSHSVHVGRHVVGVLRGPESEIGVLVVTVALVVFGRHRHQDFVVLRNVCYNSAVAAADRGTRTSLSRSI